MSGYASGPLFEPETINVNHDIMSIYNAMEEKVVRIRKRRSLNTLSDHVSELIISLFQNAGGYSRLGNVETEGVPNGLET